MPLNIRKSKKKLLNSTCHLDIQTWIFLGDLIAHGYPFMDALVFLNVDTTPIIRQLEHGKEAISILLEGEQGRFYEHLRFFITIMSLPDAITSAQSLQTFEKGLKSKFLKKSVYPICILLFAYGMLWVFSSAIIPQMMMSFSMDEQFIGLALMVHIIQLCCYILGFLVIGSLLLYLYLKLHPNVRSAILYKYHKYVCIVKDYESFILAGYLLEMQKKGISTKQSFSFLSKIDPNSVFHLMIQDIVSQLHKGEDYFFVLAHNPMINERFEMSFKIGSSSMKVEDMLVSFMKQQEYAWDNTIKKVSISLQIIAYIFVGFVVLIVYQIMLVPLSMLEQM